MANIRDKTEQIRKSVYGKDVRENIASSIEAISDESNTFQTNITKQFNDVETDLQNKFNDIKTTLTDRQSRVEIRENNLENTFNQIINEAVSDSPSSAETVHARTDTVNNITYRNLGERIDSIMTLLGEIPIDGGTFFENYIEFKIDGGTF